MNTATRVDHGPVTGRDDDVGPGPTAGPVRSDLVVVAVALLLLGVAVAVPLLASPGYRAAVFAASAPLMGYWGPHLGWGTPFAVLIAAAVVLAGPPVARRLSWRPLLGAVFATALAWTFALAMVDGWGAGFADRLAAPDQYLADVARVPDIGRAMAEFSSRIVARPGSWFTHTSGHPAGALLSYLLLDRIGLGGGVWAAVVSLVAGAAALVAVLVTVRALAADPARGEELARRAAPFLALAPAAVWIGVSADALFAGVTAGGIALLALSARRRVRSPVLAAVGAGLLLGYGIFLSYGLTLMGLLAVAVLVATRSARPLLAAVPAALAVVAAFALAGFWWPDGYHLVRIRYHQDVGSTRPFGYWVWANLAATLCAVGFASAAGVWRSLAPRLVRLRDPLALVVGAALLMVLVADLSGLSKAETERIWLPFEIWLLAATARLPPSRARWWLLAQGVLALAVNHLVVTAW